MSLPLELTVTGLAFEGVLIVAFEGGRRRLHLSLVEAADSDPAITPGRRPSGTFSRPAGLGPNAAGLKPVASVGARILRSAQVESEVGQADKHVLKNVGKVEKFVLEVARKTLENELVFPCVALANFPPEGNFADLFPCLSSAETSSPSCTSPSCSRFSSLLPHYLPLS